jgi:hypothetical protein
MPESFVQVPPDSTGKKLRTRERTVGANTVEEQYVALASDATYYVWVPSLVNAANKYYLAFLNNAASGQVLKVRKLFLANSSLAAVTGVGVQFNLLRISAITGGTAVTANPVDTTDGALANYTAVYAATSVTAGVTLFSWFTMNDEVGVIGNIVQSTIQALTSLLPEGPEIKELTLNAGEGFALQQITSTIAGNFGVLAVITKSA